MTATGADLVPATRNALSLLLGRPPSPIDRDGNPLEMLPPAIPAGLPASLLERRPDVLEAEQLLAAANADIGAAKALFYPTISLTGFGGAVGADLSKFLGGTGAIWSIGAGLLQPIYNGGRNRANLEAARARFDQALVVCRDAVAAERQDERRAAPRCVVGVHEPVSEPV